MTDLRTVGSWALAATSLGFGVVQLDVGVVNVAIQPIRDDLHTTVSGTQWVVSAYTVAFAAFILSAGALGDRIGAKRVFVAGFALFTGASICCALAPSLPLLIAFRALQGVGAAVLVPCSLTLLNHAYPQPAERARAVGLWAAGASVGLSGGPLVGGVLTSTLSWRWIFLINVPLGLLGIGLTLRYATETRRSPERAVDVTGQVLAVVALGLLAAASIGGGRRGFTDPAIIVGFLLAAIALAGFLIAERRSTAPMLPLTMFSNGTFAAASAIGLVINIAFYGLIFVLSLYFQIVRHYSVLATGLAFAPTTGIVLIANVLSGPLVSRVGIRQVIGGSGLLMAGCLAALLQAGPSTPYAVLVVPLMLLGAALGLLVPAMTSALLSSADKSRSGVASGTLNTARQTGSVLGVAIFGSLAATDVLDGLHRSVMASMGLALVVVALTTRMRS
jgi:MFS transporter, DHA2 family, methylenomycin A resistance protein